MQDTPGWEAISDNMEPITAHIHECNLKCLENEQVCRLCSLPDLLSSMA